MQHRPPPTHASVNPIAIEIVENQRLFREGLAALLHASDEFHVVATASSADEAAPLAEQHAPRVVLLGIDAPGGSLTALRAIARTPDAPRVLLVVDAPTDAQFRDGLAAGAAGFVAKSDSFDDLALAVRQAAAGQFAASSSLRGRFIETAQGTQLAAASPGSDLAVSLTPREKQVLELLATGHTVKQAADKLGISASTVDNHKARMMRKLKLHKTVELTLYAIRNGLLGE